MYYREFFLCVHLHSITPWPSGGLSDLLQRRILGIFYLSTVRCAVKRNTSSRRRRQLHKWSDSGTPSQAEWNGASSQARLPEFGEDVPSSFHYAVARKKRLTTFEWRLACHGVAHKGADGRLRYFFALKSRQKNGVQVFFSAPRFYRREFKSLWYQ